MPVTQRYKTVKRVTHEFVVIVLGTLLMCDGPILYGFGIIGG